MTRNVFFSIPFAGKRDDAGWTIACRLLGNTLASVLNQTNPAFKVVITGHERPPVEALNDPRVVFLEADYEKPTDREGYKKDKKLKRRSNASYISSQGGGLIIFLDADDYVSKKLVDYMRNHNNPNGYYFNKGYVLDYGSQIIGSFSKFYRRCGTCGALRFTSAEIDDGLSKKPGSYYAKFRRHGSWPDVAAGEGRLLHPIPFPAAVYLLNTSQNLSSGRGEAVLARRLKAVRKRRVALSRSLVEEFSLGPIASPGSLKDRIGGTGRAFLAGLARRVLP